MSIYLIFGASRGLGAAFNAGLPKAGDTVWLVSRSRPNLDSTDGVTRTWIQADLSLPDAHERIAQALGDHSLDVAIYNAGIWEQKAWHSDYDYAQVSVSEVQKILQVNLTSAVTCIQSVLPHLRRAEHGKIILIGSTSGLENTGSTPVAYTASKFGLRGLAHALRENLRNEGIAVTCINPGWLANEMPYEKGTEAVLSAYGGTRIPLGDIVALVKSLLDLSFVACVKEIDVPAITDTNA